MLLFSEFELEHLFYNWSTIFILIFTIAENSGINILILFLIFLQYSEDVCSINVD